MHIYVYVNSDHKALLGTLTVIETFISYDFEENTKKYEFAFNNKNMKWYVETII